jgi:hypothetical protein
MTAKSEAPGGAKGDVRPLHEVPAEIRKAGERLLERLCQFDAAGRSMHYGDEREAYGESHAPSRGEFRLRFDALVALLAAFRAWVVAGLAPSVESLARQVAREEVAVRLRQVPADILAGWPEERRAAVVEALRAALRIAPFKMEEPTLAQWVNAQLRATRKPQAGGGEMLLGLTHLVVSGEVRCARVGIQRTLVYWLTERTDLPDRAGRCLPDDVDELRVAADPPAGDFPPDGPSSDRAPSPAEEPVLPPEAERFKHPGFRAAFNELRPLDPDAPPEVQALVRALGDEGIAAGVLGTERAALAVERRAAVVPGGFGAVVRADGELPS